MTIKRQDYAIIKPVVIMSKWYLSRWWLLFVDAKVDI